MDVETPELEVPAHPDKGRVSGSSPGSAMRRSSFGARASSFLSEAVGPRASMAAERVSIFATNAADDFVKTPARRPHRATVKFGEEEESDKKPLQRTESAFMGAGRVAAGQLQRQMSGTGQYGVESEVSPYVLACTRHFGNVAAPPDA